MISDKTVADFIALPRGAIDANHKAVELAVLHRQVRALESIAESLMKIANPPVATVPAQPATPEPAHAAAQGKVEGHV